MKEYLLVFRDTMETEKSWQEMSPEVLQALMAKWGAWMGEVTAAGKMAGGNRLSTSGKVMHGTGRSITDGPYVEAKELVGGYILIKADGYDEAVQLTQGCPALLSDTGSVEIREVMQMS
jgi:hypothetical protein